MIDNSFDDELMLLHEMANGSKKAFEVLYDRYYISTYYYARRWVREEKAAEDITLESFLKLWERLPRFTTLQAVRAFLHITAKNACLNYLRSQLRATAHHRNLAYMLAQEKDDDPAEQQVTARIYEYIYKEIDRLPPQARKVFRMSYIEGLSNQAIADQLQINNQSVRNHKANALKYLRMALLNKDFYKLCSLFCLFLFNNFSPF